jgi:hypothetical protein
VNRGTKTDSTQVRTEDRLCYTRFVNTRDLLGSSASEHHTKDWNDTGKVAPVPELFQGPTPFLAVFYLFYFYFTLHSEDPD